MPYQLHACPLVDATLDEERKDDAAGVDERGTEPGAIDDGATELVRATLDIAGVLDVTTVLHTAPVIAGTCALPAPLVPWIPNSTLEFTAILLFQFSGVAV